MENDRDQRPDGARSSGPTPGGGSAARRVADWFGWAALESPSLTVTFWLAVALFAGAYFLTPLPPCIDYPQHLALGAIMGRLLDPASPEHQLYEVTLLTYNGLFHVLVAGLSLLMRPELAGKLVLVAGVVLTAAAGLGVAQVGRRPRWHAFFILPFCYGHIAGWGFVNYSLAAPLALLTWCWWLRWRDGESRLGWRVVVAALLVAYAHVLATACLCISVALAQLYTHSPREVGCRRWVRDLLRAPLPVLPAAVFSIIVFFHHRAAPHIFWEPFKDGTDSPAWEKLWYLASFSVSNFWDASDQMLFWCGIGLLAILFLAPLWTRSARGPAPRRELVGLAISWFLLYLIVPRVLMSTWYIFERLPLWWLAFALGCAPVPRPSLAVPIRHLATLVGLAAGLNTAYHFYVIPDARDASAIIDDIPAGARVAPVMHHSDAHPALWRRIWVHLAAYHVVRRPGELAFSFTLYASLPVRYREGQSKPGYYRGLEWNPDQYDPAAEYGRYFDTVLVSTPDDAPGVDPRARTFGYYAPWVRLMAQRGRFYLYDASAIHAPR